MVGSRRGFLALAAGSCCWGQSGAGLGGVYPSEWKRYLDPGTEFPVTRLTDPKSTSYLTAPYNRAFGGRNFLLLASDRGGKPDVYRLDLRSGQLRRLTDAAHLEPRSIALLPGDRSFCYIDGASIRVANLAKARERVVYDATAPYQRLTELCVGPEAHAYVVECGAGRYRLQRVPLVGGAVVSVIESEEVISTPLARPGGGVAYRRGAGFYFRGRPDTEQQLPIAPGGVGAGYWSPDGASLYYLSLHESGGERNSIRELNLATGQDRLVAKTSQFVQFAPNADASVFAGASGSKASPYILILLRSVKRELSMCEHGARDPASLAIAFSPNSQRIVFRSDRHGKPALYALAVERFVEETQS